MWRDKQTSAKYKAGLWFRADTAILLDKNLNNSLLAKDSSDYINSMSLLSRNYCNYYTGTLSDPTLNSLINSVLVRNDSLSFHLKLIQEYQGIHPEILNLIQSQKAITEKTYLFDSFIFNMVSAIDYSASLTYFLLTQSQDYKKTWKKVYTFLGSSDKFRNSEIKKYVYNQHVWLNKLIEYRADLIHYKIAKAPNTVSIAYHLNQTVIEIQPPVNFERHFRELHGIASTDKDIDKVSFWLLLNYRKSSLELIKLLANYIKENKKGDFEIITITG